MRKFSYLCKVKRMYGVIFIMAAAVWIALFCYYRQPVVAGSWTKQTLYLWLTDTWHGQAKSAEARFLLIDDDSGDGVFTLKQLCDSLQLKATFAVIPQRMSSRVSDSLRNWQAEGYGIALHGLNHERWTEWNKERVMADIDQSISHLAQRGFNTSSISYVVPPHACNTRAIRAAVRAKGYKMVTGANIVNPDTTLFQYGRIFITRDTNMDELQSVLKRAYDNKGYVILGTHSSMAGEFSAEKTQAALQMVKIIGFEY